MKNSLTASPNNNLMNLAARLAYRKQGLTFPNPSVGAVISKDNKIIATATTGDHGSPHAEANAIKLAGNLTEGADLYVTLEPCFHYGKNPPCVDNIIQSKFKNIFIGSLDPNPKVSGQTIQKLKEHNLNVVLLNAEETNWLHRAFIKTMKTNIPYITSKIALSLDSKIALSNGKSKWITNEYSRKLVHLLRYKSDAILSGIGTVKYDNPNFNCRIPGISNNNPIRVIIDSKLQINTDCNLVRTAKEQPLWIATNEKIIASKQAELLTKKNVKLIPIKLKGSHLDLNSLMRILAKKNITNIFCEAGQRLNNLLLQKKLIDEMLIFRSSKIFGSDATDFIGNLNLQEVIQANNFKVIQSKILPGENIFERYVAEN